jgi:hypothetical protein
MISAARLPFRAVPLHPYHQSLDAFKTTRDDNTQHLWDRQPRDIPAMPSSWPGRAAASAREPPISAYRMIPAPIPGMITLGADTLAAHPARIGINAGERLSDFALIVLALDSSRGEIKIVPGQMLAAFTSG